MQVVLILPLLLFSSISPALTEKPVNHAELSASFYVWYVNILHTQFDGEEVPFYSNNHDVLVTCNSTDTQIWRETFQNMSIPD